MTSTRTTSTTSLPTLGDRPTDPTSAGPRKRRFGRKLALAGVASLLVLGSAGSAMAVTQGFSDVGNDHPFKNDINWVADQGIASGYPDGTYKPTAPVSRQAMASFIHKYANETEKVTTNISFTNVGSYTNSAECPAGKRPVGGGGQVNSPGFAITDSYISNTNSWTVRWETKNAEYKTGAGTVFVICAPLG